MQRKLAAILSADVQGYSRLMGDDEEATIRTLTAYRELMTHAIERHNGRVVDSPGDNLLAEFASAVEALQGAVFIQKELAGRNADLPDSRKMAYRIGINVGDVVVEGERIYGDGVNIAARLESLADGGGICISEAVHTQVEGKLPFMHEFLGEQAVKNIAKPVRTYRIVLDGQSAPPAAKDAEAAPPLPDKPSIAVLAFDNLSGDPDQEYFSDGISEDIITDLSKVSGLFVIARNSSFAFKGRSMDLTDVSSKLGVRYVLEGSVRKAGGRVRINAQLIDGGTGGHLWADRYDGSLDDIFAMQDEVTKKIVGALQVALTPDERRRVETSSAVDAAAYDYYLRGRELTYRHTRDAIEDSRPLLERAAAIDPKFVKPYVELAHGYLTDYANGWTDPPEEALARGLELGRKAAELDDQDPEAYFALATACIWHGDLEQGAAYANRGIALDANNSNAYAMRGLALHYAGDSEGALEDFRKAVRLDPQGPDLGWHFLAQACFMLEQYEEAAEALRHRLMLNPRSDISHALLAACYGHLGRYEEAREAWRRTLECNPEYSLEQKRRTLPYKNPADFERIVDGLRKAGLP